MAGEAGHKPGGKRLESVDVAKGIAIIAIVMGHLGFTGLTGDNDVYRIVFQFHVPIFFIIAGYFLSTKRSLGAFAAQKARRLLLPYVFTCALLLLARMVVTLVLNGAGDAGREFDVVGFLLAALYGSGTDFNLPGSLSAIGAIWFLEALLVALLEVRILLRWKKAAPVVVIVLFVLAAWSSTVLWLPFNIQSGFLGGGFVYVGYLLRKAEFMTRRITPWLLVGTIAVCAAAFAFNVNVSLASGYLGPWFLGVPVAVSTSCLVLLLSKGIADHLGPLKRLLSFYGRNSLIVLCVHLVLLNLGVESVLALVGVPYDWNIIFFVNVAIQLVVCALAVKIVERSRFLRAVFAA